MDVATSGQMWTSISVEECGRCSIDTATASELTTLISIGSEIDFVFDIRFESAGSDELAVGTIVLGSFRETFESPLHVWSREDYEDHWSEGLERLIEGASSTALITEMYDPAAANFIRWWPAYRFESEVRFHNQLLLLSDLQFPFDPGDPFEHVPPYQQINEEGDRLSEWSIGIDVLRSFASSHRSDTKEAADEPAQIRRAARDPS